jgi:hypothetical protein
MACGLIPQQVPLADSPSRNHQLPSMKQVGNFKFQVHRVNDGTVAPTLPRAWLGTDVVESNQDLLAGC